MDPKIVESELKNHKIREGPIYKRTKFLQEWRERWMVLTMNYILIFTNRNLKELAQFIDLREVKTYKSYLRKQEDMIPAGFKIRTLEDMFYFCARNCNQKWTWIVSLQRLMDFKYAGKSPYNNAEWIKNKGFMGQREFQIGKFDEPQFQAPPQPQKPKEVPKPQEEPAVKVSQVSNEELENKVRLVNEELKRLEEKQSQMQQKQSQQEALFLFELNKLKKAEEALKELQIQVEERARQIQEGASLAQKDMGQERGPTTESQLNAVIERAEEQARNSEEVRDAFEQPLEPEEVEQKQQKQSAEESIKAAEEAAVVAHIASRQSTTSPLNVEKSPEPSEQTIETNQVAVEKQPEMEKKEEKVEAKVEEKVEAKQQKIPITTSQISSPQKPTQDISSSSQMSSPGDSPSNIKKASAMSKKILDMKSFFQSKGSVMKPPSDSINNPLGATSKPQPKEEKKVQKKDDTVALHMCRDKVVVNLLEEFHPKAYNYPGLRYIIQFLITICAERTLGYQSFLIREAKANQNRFLFAEVLLELISDYKKYENFVSIAKIIECLIFQAPGIFKLNHYDMIKRKLVDLVNNAPEAHPEMPSLLKTLYVVHKMKNLDKDGQFKAKLGSISEKMISIEGKNWARKLIEDL